MAHFLECLGLTSESKTCQHGMNWPSAPNQIMLYTMMKEETTTLGYKSITLFILLGVKASVMWETDRGRQRQTALLTHNFFSWPYHAVLPSRPHLTLLLLLGWGRVYSAWGLLLTAAPVGTLNDCKMGLTQLTLTLTDLGICTYHFIIPTISDQPCDCFCLFTQVCPFYRNLWLTAQLKVNVQQMKIHHFNDVNWIKKLALMKKMYKYIICNNHISFILFIIVILHRISNRWEIIYKMKYQNFPCQWTCLFSFRIKWFEWSVSCRNDYF